ncbi:calcium-binding and coiled-coil domain-containing protein 2-like [Odontomachus brunneus]|uniref:calcium-binding and coiled-coil domain-containing protein 2-like n=1 Tax=Odontomachus brunneus TaxID=486640 RepID=UPI0013F1F6FD|nr:calcium-binding and coiled-coil domain-containing protein 2-like [Odontomachus brunneus]
MERKGKWPDPEDEGWNRDFILERLSYLKESARAIESVTSRSKRMSRTEKEEIGKRKEELQRYGEDMAKTFGTRTVYLEKYVMTLEKWVDEGVELERRNNKEIVEWQERGEKWELERKKWKEKELKWNRDREAWNKERRGWMLKKEDLGKCMAEVVKMCGENRPVRAAKTEDRAVSPFPEVRPEARDRATSPLREVVAGVPPAGRRPVASAAPAAVPSNSRS